MPIGQENQMEGVLHGGLAYKEERCKPDFEAIIAQNQKQIDACNHLIKAMEAYCIEFAIYEGSSTLGPFLGNLRLQVLRHTQYREEMLKLMESGKD